MKKVRYDWDGGLTIIFSWFCAYNFLTCSIKNKLLKLNVIK